MVSERVCGGRRSGCARGRIDERDGVVCFGRILDVGVVRSQGLRIVVVLLLLALGLLLFVELALVLLVFRYAGLQGIG